MDELTLSSKPYDPAVTVPTLDAATVTMADQTYTGSALKPKVTVKLDGKTLVEGTDYTVVYANNTKVGTA